MTSHDTMLVFQSDPFDSGDDSNSKSSSRTSSSSSAPSTSFDSLADDTENKVPLDLVEKLKAKLKETRRDLNMALDASREWRERVRELEKRDEEADKLQERLDEYDGILLSMRRGHTMARDGVKVEVEDWETMVNKTLRRSNATTCLDRTLTTANLDFLKKLMDDTEELTVEINRTRMMEKENLLRIRALENTLENTKQKNAAEKMSLYNTVEGLQHKLTTAESFNESLKSAKDMSEDVAAEILRRSNENGSKRIEELLRAEMEKDSQIAQLIEELGIIHSKANVAEDLIHKQTASIGELTSKNKNLQNRLRIQEEGFNEEQMRLNAAYSRLHSDYKSLQRTMKNETKDHEKEMETQKKLIEKISRQNECLEKQVSDLEKADSRNAKLMKGLREQNDDLVGKLSKRKEEIRELKERLESQANISKPKLRLVSDSARNSPRLQMRQEKIIKVEEEVECLPDSESDDIIVTKRLIPKRVRLLSSPTKSASKKLKM